MSQEVKTTFPVERLDCVGRPFGYDLATALDFHAPLRLTSEHRVMVDAMRSNLDQLTASDDPYDQESVKTIGAFYQNNDLWALRVERENLRASRDIIAWLGHTSMRNVAQFAIWNTERYNFFQSRLAQDHVAMTNDTLQKTQRLVDLELFPKIALSQIKRAIGAYGTLHAMDSFEAGARQANGYCTPRVIASANNYILPDIMEGMSSEMEGTVFHEYLHGASIQSATGFINGIATEGGHRWLDESFVEHATQVARDRLQPDITVIRPSKRRDIGASNIYPQERTVLAALTSNDAADIPIDLLAAAYFSPLESRERQEVEHRLNSFLSQVIPNSDGHGLHAFSEQYETDHQQGIQTHTLTKLLDAVGVYSDNEVNENSVVPPVDALAYVTIDELIDYSIR
jgi:hypothetical protein